MLAPDFGLLSDLGLLAASGEQIRAVGVPSPVAIGLLDPLGAELDVDAPPARMEDRKVSGPTVEAVSGGGLSQLGRHCTLEQLLGTP